jgi:hypothetical protein
MKIVNIEKKPWFRRIFSIKYWWVYVEMDDGRVKRFSCWAGCPDISGVGPDKDRLLWSLNQQLNPSKEKEKTDGLEGNLEELIGTEITLK